MKHAALLTLSLSLACHSASSEVPAPDGARTAAKSPIPDGYHTVTPIVVVPDVAAALSWYGEAFGARTDMTLEAPGGAVMHAQIVIDDTRLMIVTEDAEQDSLAPKQLGGSNASFFMYVEDVDASFARAVELGAEPTSTPTDMMWGDRVAEITDPAGYRWYLATYTEAVGAEELEARRAADGAALAAGEPTPAITLEHTAPTWKPDGYQAVMAQFVVDGGVETLAFYEQAFGAEVTEVVLMPDGHTLLHAEFRLGDSMLMLEGTFDRTPQAKGAAALGGAAVSFYVYVEEVDPTWAKAVDGGASVVTEVTEEPWGDRLGVVADPSGNHWGFASRVRDIPPEEIAKQLAGTDGDPQ